MMVHVDQSCARIRDSSLDSRPFRLPVMGLVGALELECGLRLGLILALVAGGDEGVGHEEVSFDGDVGVQASFHDEGAGYGTGVKLGGGKSAVAGYRDGGEYRAGEGEGDVLCDGPGFSGREICYPGGARVVDNPGRCPSFQVIASATTPLAWPGSDKSAAVAWRRCVSGIFAGPLMLSTASSSYAGFP